MTLGALLEFRLAENSRSSFSLLYSVSGKAASSATNNVISTFPDPGSS
jgi:hypothetical protein